MQITIVMGGGPKKPSPKKDNSNFWSPQQKVKIEGTANRIGKNILDRMGAKAKTTRGGIMRHGGSGDQSPILMDET